MKIEDIDQVVKLETKYLGETLGYEMILNEINNNSNQELEGVLFYVIEENEKVIGYIGRYYFLKSMEILNFVIDEAYQRQGYGQKLFNKIVEDVTDLESITLEVRVSNQKAIAFYEKNGFIHVHTRKQYYSNGEDAKVLLKEFI